MKTVPITYTLTELTEGYLARCVTSNFVAAYGKTKEEAGENLVDAIRMYVQLYPDRAGAVLKSLPTKELVMDDSCCGVQSP